MKSKKGFCNKKILPATMLGGSIALLLLATCSPFRNNELLLWSHNEEEITSGSILQVISESEIRSMKLVRYIDPNGHEQRRELESWRLSSDSSGRSIKELQELYLPHAPYYGISEIQALPVREEPSSQADILYRLKEDELVKILSQSDDPVEVGGISDYWFEILTETGTRGYVFGYRLNKVDNLGVSVEEKDGGSDEYLALVLNNVWYPDYIIEMINSQIFDLNVFRSEYQFYHANNQFVLNTPQYLKTFEYSEIIPVRYREYLALGSGLHFIVYEDDRIRIQFTHADQPVAANYLRLPSDISFNDVLEEELHRRQLLFQAFIQHGKRFSSNRYGDVTILDNGSGLWQSYANAQLDIFPDWFQGEFKVEFPLYLSSSLEDDYDGALSFTNPGESRLHGINFLYTFTSTSELMLEHIPDFGINGVFVERRSREPVLLYFRPSN